MESYFTEVEAASAAGVSIETIREFASIGVLRGRQENGHQLFSKSDLQSVFQSLKPISTNSSSEASLPEAPKSESAPVVLKEEPVVATPPPTPEVEHSVIIETSLPKEPQALQVAEPVTEPSPERITKSEPTVIDRDSFELLELNQSLRDQIQMLREERDWLRKRVEVLEVRGERDQMLLISEARTVQNLLPERKSPFRFFSSLPWFNSSK